MTNEERGCQIAQVAAEVRSIVELTKAAGEHLLDLSAEVAVTLDMIEGIERVFEVELETIGAQGIAAAGVGDVPTEQRTGTL